MTHVTCRLTDKNRDQLRNFTLGSQVWATFTFLPVFHKIITFCNAVNCRFELALEVQRWTRARSECLPGGGKNYSYGTLGVRVGMMDRPTSLKINNNVLQTTRNMVWYGMVNVNMVLLTCLTPKICWYNYRNRAAVFCFLVRTLVKPTIILSTTWFPFSKLIRFFKKQGWIHGKSRKLICWITAEILLLFKCLSYMYHEEQGCIFSY